MHADRSMIRLTWIPSPMDSEALRLAAKTVTEGAEAAVFWHEVS
jgi:hypothetical protein